MRTIINHNGQHKPLDVITLFHKASSPASVRLAAVLQQRSVAATEASTEDKPGRPEFKLEITENPPTPEQLQTILEYAGSKRISTIIRGATNQTEALRKFKESPDNFIRPVVCICSVSLALINADKWL